MNPEHAPPRGLLHRLHSRAPRRSSQNAILAHLQVLLATRLGESLSAPRLGLVDFADIVHGFPASMQLLRHTIQDMLTRYEPRLERISVDPIDTEDPLTLSLRITAQLRGSRGGQLQLRTELSASGRVHVHGS